MSAIAPTNRSRRLLLAATAATLICWFLPGAFMLVYPFRLLVTFVHEGAHALVTVLTGGSVVDIMLDPAGNGITRSNGGLPVMIYPAGYVGTTALGALLLLWAKPRNGKNVLGILALSVAIVTLLWVRNPFGVIVGLMWCGVLLAMRKYAASPVADFAASFLAVQLCLNAVLDIRTLLVLTTSTGMANDAVFMADAYGLTPWFWAGLWSILSLIILAIALRSAWSGRRT